MGWITLEDLDGTIDGVLWAETLAEITEKYPTAIANESVVFVKGKVDKKRETPSLQINEVIPVEDAGPRLATSLVIKLDRMRHNRDVIEQIKPILSSHSGRLPVYVSVALDHPRTLLLRLGAEHSVRSDAALIGDLERILGAGAVQLVGPGMKRMKRPAQQPLFDGASTEPEAPSATRDNAPEEMALAHDGAEE